MNGSRSSALRSAIVLVGVLVGLLVAGCRGCRGSEDASREPCPALEPAAPWLVLRAIDEQQGILRLLPLELSGGQMAPRSLRTLAAEPVANWPGHYQATVAQGGRLVAAVTPGVADSTAPVRPTEAPPDATSSGADRGASPPVWLTVLRLDDADRPALRVPLGPLHPDALHLVGERTVVLRAGSIVSAIDLTKHEHPPATLGSFGTTDRGASSRTPCLFARSRGRLLSFARDAEPPRAATFEVDCAGAIRPDEPLALPRLSNGSYSEALIDDGELLLVAHYDVAKGAGHLLARIALAKLADPEIGNLELNAPSSTRPPTVDEFEPEKEEQADERRLLAGHEMTPWAGLGVLGDHLLLGAGARGVLVVDRRFDADAQALAVDVGGRCLDLAVRDEAAYVLVERSDRTSVRRVVFDRPRSRFVVASETAVDGRWESFLR